MVLRRVAALPASYMAISLLGFLLSAVYLVQYNLTWGVAFSLIFMMMFLSAMIAMERASPDKQLAAIPGTKLPPMKRKRRRKRK